MVGSVNYLIFVFDTVGFFYFYGLSVEHALHNKLLSEQVDIYGSSSHVYNMGLNIFWALNFFLNYYCRFLFLFFLL